MKPIVLIIAISAFCIKGTAQVNQGNGTLNNNTSTSNVMLSAPAPGYNGNSTQNPPVNPANQVPNYSQNNASYNNNSTQSNKPDTNGSFPGNGQYMDRTRDNTGTTGNGSQGVIFNR